jgi:SAM-dependent methyltransferase
VTLTFAGWSGERVALTGHRILEGSSASADDDRVQYSPVRPAGVEPPNSALACGLTAAQGCRDTPDSLVPMTSTLARYDDFAEWYEQWTSGFGPCLISAHAELIPPLTGLRVLDLACGHGRLTRDLARAGAKVVGVDFSGALLDKARAQDSAGIDYVQADVTRAPSWWDGLPFDGCTCELALMDIDDLSGTLSTVATVLCQGGWFVASIVHPCFPGNDTGLSSWPAEGWLRR